MRDEIAAFGGDPDRVTAMGQSAGAHAIACLMTVPAARPLFRRAILQSGQLGLGLSSEERAAKVAGYVADALDGADPVTADVGTLLRAQRRAVIRAAGPGGLDASPAFAPVDGVAPLAPGTTWADAARSGHDLIVGTTADEAETFLRISPALDRVRRLPVLGRVAGLGSAVATHRVFGAAARRLADHAARAGSRVHHYLVEWRAPDSGARRVPLHRPAVPLRHAGGVDGRPDARRGRLGRRHRTARRTDAGRLAGLRPRRGPRGGLAAPRPRGGSRCPVRVALTLLVVLRRGHAPEEKR